MQVSHCKLLTQHALHSIILPVFGTRDEEDQIATAEAILRSPDLSFKTRFVLRMRCLLNRGPGCPSISRQGGHG